jgi:phosphotransferase system  glucose/maltose/N-acetylglucosamine-specific IIC component
VRLVVEAFVELAKVTDEDGDTMFGAFSVPVTVRLVTVVLASVVVPVTARPPPIDWFPVTVEVPIVAELAVRYVVTALVVVLLPITTLVKLAKADDNEDEKYPEVLVLLVMKASVE